MANLPEPEPNPNPEELRGHFYQPDPAELNPISPVFNPTQPGIPVGSGTKGKVFLGGLKKNNRRSTKDASGV